MVSTGDSGGRFSDEEDCPLGDGEQWEPHESFDREEEWPSKVVSVESVGSTVMAHNRINVHLPLLIFNKILRQ